MDGLAGSALLVSLPRYRVYDAESAISRSVAYGALTLALLAPGGMIGVIPRCQPVVTQ